MRNFFIGLITPFVIDILHYLTELLQAFIANKIAKYQFAVQRMAMEFEKDYGESASQNTNVMGFSMEDDYYDDED